MFRIYPICIFLLFSFLLQAQQVSTLLTKPNAGFEAITWLPDGRIYVVDYVLGEVYRLDLQGNLTNIGAFFGALGGAYDKDGNFYFSEFGNGKIIKVTPDDQTEVYSSGFFGPAGILIDDENQLMYVANYNANSIFKVDMTDPNPSPELLAEGGLIDGPDGLVFSPEGDIISANFDDNSIQRITPEGEVSQFTTLPGSSKSGYIVTREDGYIITGANGSPRIFNISATGEVTTLAGSGITGYSDGSATEALFNFPNGIAISPSGDSLLIAESSASGHIRLITDLDPTVIVNTTAPMTDLDWSIYPNPTTNSISLYMQIPQKSWLTIELMDTKGALVDTLVPGQEYSGDYKQTFERQEQWKSGLYFIKVAINDQIFQRSIVLE